MEQLQDRYGIYKFDGERPFKMIENYIYLYHTDTLVALPLYPESIQDTMGVSFSEQSIMSRTAPIYSYSSSGPRSLQLDLPLHRDMMTQVNKSCSLALNTELDDDYVDLLVRQLQSAALPKYSAAERMVNPPMVAVRFGNSIFCKGVINGNVSVTHSGPIISYSDTVEKYALLTVNFSIQEVDPYDAETVALVGGYRGLSTTLERRIYKTMR